MPALNETITAYRMNRKSWHRWAMAAAFTAAAHLILLALFKETPGQAPLPSQEFKKVVFLPLDERLPVSAEKLKLAILYGNPEAISKPSLSYGFSSAIARNGLRKQIKDLECRKEIMPDVQDRKIPFMKFETAPENSEDKISKLWKRSPSDSPVSDSIHDKPPAIPEYPMWRTMDGDLLPQLFPNLESVRKDIEKLKPLKPTVLKVALRGEGFLPRVELDSSSSCPELDRLAIGAFLSRAGPAVSSFAGCDRCMSVEIIWNKGGIVK